MIILDMYWETNPDWYHFIVLPNGIKRKVINSSAPPDAQKSYENYRKQMDYINKMAQEDPDLSIL